MVWPATPLPVRIGLDVAGVDTDITAYQYSPRGTLRISRGRADEQSQPGPTVLDGLVLNNRDGRFTPRLPTGAWYGQISRGSHLGVGIKGADTRLILSGAKPDVISSPDSASLSITGDIEVRVDAQLCWVQYSNYYLASKWNSSSQRSWLIRMEPEGWVRWWWTTDGVTQQYVTSTRPLEAPHGRIALAVTHDVNDGSGGNVVRFWTAPSLGGPWSELGQPIVTAGTTSIFDSTAPVEWGGCSTVVRPNALGSLHGWQLWSGIAAAGGTLVSGMDLSGEAAGAATVSDGTRTWTLQGGTALVDVDPRAVAEVAAWPVRWDTTGVDATCVPEASGIMRRLSGTSWTAFQSALFRTIRGYSTDAYWPCEDGKTATSLASAVAGVDPMTIVGTPTMAGDETIVGSVPLPVLKDAQFTGRMPAPYAATGISTVQWVMRIDTSTVTPASGQTIMSGYMEPTTTPGPTIDKWELSYRSGGGLRLLIYAYGVIIMDSGTYAFGVLDKILTVSVQLSDDGAGGLDWAVVTIEAGEVAGLGLTGNLAGWVTGGLRALRVNEAGGLVDVTVGHVWVRSTEAVTQFELGMSAGGWAGETAGARIVRLCTEEGIPVDLRGAPVRTPLMGPQPTTTLMDALSQCEAIDGGLLFEPRDRVGIAYRTLSSLLDQDPAVTVSRSGHQLVDPWEPVDDDRGLANDITVTRPDGSMVHLVDATGPLGTAQPPAGVGVYAEDVELNAFEDSQLGDLAGWRLRQGTVDAPRLSALTVNMATPEVLADSTASAGVLGVDVGDVIEVTGLPAQMPPDPIRVLVTGVTETMAQHTRIVQATGGPAARTDTATWQPDTTFSDDFESGGLTAWPTVTGAASVVAGAARAGSNGLRLTPSAGTAATVATSTTKWTQNQRWAQVSLRIRLGTLPASGSMSLVTIQTTAGAGHLDFFVHSSGRFWCDLVGGSSDLDTGIVAVTGQWYDVQLRVFYGDTVWHAWLHLDGVTYGPLTQAASTPSYVRSLHLGTSSTTTAWSADVDSVHIDVGDIAPSAWEETCTRYDTAGSTLTAGITAAATSMQVTTGTGPVWTTDEAMLPFDLCVGGERVRVEAVAGSTSPQTMTVVRAVNGVVRAHSAGAVVGLWKPARYAIL